VARQRDAVPRPRVGEEAQDVEQQRLRQVQERGARRGVLSHAMRWDAAMGGWGWDGMGDAPPRPAKSSSPFFLSLARAERGAVGGRRRRRGGMRPAAAGEGGRVEWGRGDTTGSSTAK